MTTLLIAHIGSYPRIGEEKDQQRHRRGVGHFERKEISAHAFRDVQQSVTQELIHEQLNAGLDQVTDGLVAWQDPISHFCKNAAGFERGGLAQYFHTNFYYRRPKLVSKPKWKTSAIAEEFQFAQSVSNKPVRAVLTGPLTLATHVESTLKSTNNIAARVDMFSEVLTMEIHALLKLNPKVIQIDEPQLAAEPEQFPLVKKALQKLIPASTEVKFVLALYFENLLPLWDKLQELPVQGLNLDLATNGEALLKRLLEKPGQKDIGLGLINALETKLENPEVLAKWVSRWLDATPAATAFITPSAGLELLPRLAAQAKLELLHKIRDLVQTPRETLANAV